jgi:hypothetical protein
MSRDSGRGLLSGKKNDGRDDDDDDACEKGLVRPERIELPTSWFVAMHSIQLSYGRINEIAQ